MTGVVYGEETAPRYEYDYNAKGQVARVRDNLLNRTTQSEYDLANRPVRVKTSEDAKHVYTGQVAYDNVYGNLSEFTEKVGENRQEFGTKFGYDDENRPTSLTYSIGATTIGQSTTTIDKLNRTTFSAVKLGSKTFTSEYHFAAGGYGTGSVTNLVSSITQPGCNCGYGYDDNGNIASATLNGKWTGYTYDALGQLVQVNDHSDTRSGENGTTWKYTYDLGGNILQKQRFAYKDTTTPLETVTYTYGDANWRDKLTAVNGSTICYDAIGNPLNDGTWTYTWQNGRQLQKMQKAGVTVEFVYNADGLRVQKTVNGVATKYTLHGKNVVHMTSGTDELHFFYDAQNRPTVVVYNGVPYAYVKSLQGDIVAILDENGNTVVSYGYDAWGATLWCTGELAETLGKVQPFRYRGYVFDEETGLYYLRSRYYSSECCRFVISDNSTGAIGKLIRSNTYAYCENNAPNKVDDDGRESMWLGRRASKKELINAVDNLPFITRAKHVGGNAYDALKTMEKYNSEIVQWAEYFEIPTAMLQSVIFREMICYGLDDVVGDRILPDASVGLAQIKPTTAIKAVQMVYGGPCQYSQEEMKKQLWNPHNSIYYAAMVLKMEAIRLDYTNTNDLTREQIQEVITKYNGDPSYGAATILYYDAFQECLMEDAMD